MFRIIDMSGCIHDAYGTFIDEYDDIQFILCDHNGKFYKSNFVSGYVRLYEENE